MKVAIKKICFLVIVFFILYVIIFLLKISPAKEARMTCISCHPKLKEESKNPVQHHPFAKGDCSVCHNPHVSTHSKLLKRSVNSLCLGCHKELSDNMAKNKVHGALAKGDCLSCHKPHSSEIKGLLKSPVEKLCINCHKEEIEKSLHFKVTHQPVAQGACSSCHESHASPRHYLLKKSSRELCIKCHTPGCKVEGVSISEFTSKMDCLSCHSGHGSNYNKLLGPKGHTAFLNGNCKTCHGEFKDLSSFKSQKVTTETCLKCHPKDKVKINTEDPHYGLSENACLFCHSPHGSSEDKLVVKFTAFCLDCHQEIDRKLKVMEKRFKGLKKGVLRNRECLACHLPVHSQTSYLFRGDDPLGLKTCARCHPREHEFTHPVGEKYKDPRNGKPLTCSSCHSMHEAKYKYLLTHEGDRELCIQCHKIP